jgi:archaellin
MHGLLAILAIVTIVVVAVVLLQKSDRVVVQGPRQASEGLQTSINVEYRIRCARCDEKIIPLTGCPVCESKIRK